MMMETLVATRQCFYGFLRTFFGFFKETIFELRFFMPECSEDFNVFAKCKA